MPNNIMLSGKGLRELVAGGEYDGCEIIKEELMSTSRWSIHYELTFKYKDKFYCTWYSRGATENQDEQPFGDEDEVLCREVEPRVVQVTKYFLVEEKS